MGQAFEGASLFKETGEGSDSDRGTTSSASMCSAVSKRNSSSCASFATFGVEIEWFSNHDGIVLRQLELRVLPKER
jgi:hypothetical protein